MIHSPPSTLFFIPSLASRLSVYEATAAEANLALPNRLTDRFPPKAPGACAKTLPAAGRLKSEDNDEDEGRSLPARRTSSRRSKPVSIDTPISGNPTASCAGPEWPHRLDLLLLNKSPPQFSRSSAFDSGNYTANVRRLAGHLGVKQCTGENDSSCKLVYMT